MFSTMESPFLACIGMVSAARTPAIVACTPEYSTQYHNSTVPMTNGTIELTRIRFMAIIAPRTTSAAIMNCNLIDAV